MEETVRTAAPTGKSRGIASHCVVLALSKAFWAFAGWQVYVEVPRTNRSVEDFGLAPPFAVAPPFVGTACYGMGIFTMSKFVDALSP